MPFPETVNQRLREAYEEMMWLASRPNVSPQQARAWYSQVVSTKLASKVRRFTGMVSRAALLHPQGRLVLEHFARQAQQISSLLERHQAESRMDAEEFITLIWEVECVHITTDGENHAVQAARGDYAAAGIELVPWADIPTESRTTLAKRLKGKVSNAGDFPV